MDFATGLIDGLFGKRTELLTTSEVNDAIRMRLEIFESSDVRYLIHSRAQRASTWTRAAAAIVNTRSS